MVSNKVCLITTAHPPFDNRIFYKQAKSLAKAGFEVTLIAQSDNKTPENIAGVTLIPLPKVKSRLKRMIAVNYRAYREARALRAAIYHFHDPEFIPMGLLLKLKGAKVIYDLHEDNLSALAYKRYIPFFLKPLVRLVIAWVEIICSRYFSMVLAEKYYRERFPAGVLVLNYPQKALFTEIDLNKTTPPAPKLLYTGVVSEDRGALIHARIIRAMKEANITFAGRCDQAVAGAIYQAAGDRSRVQITGLTGYVPFDKILELYQNESWTAGLALFPPTEHYIRKELTKLFEYMGAGIPVICSDFPAWKKIIEANGAGICVDPLDEKAVLLAVKELTGDPDKARAMGKNGREAVFKHYNWEEQFKHLEALYKELTGET